MKQSKIIGLTGSISTGKSSSVFFISKYYPVIDADTIAHSILEREDVIFLLKQAFGDDVVEHDRINRAVLGEIIFRDEIKRNLLNDITHPLIFDEIKKEIRQSQSDVVFVDIPLLIETLKSVKSYGLEFNEIWLIYTDPETQISRLMERDYISYEYARDKIASQMSIEEKRKYADVIINNSGSLADLERNISIEIRKLKERC